MAKPTLLVRALRLTAQRLSNPDTPYRWAHFGRCNCGQLAQTLTGLAPDGLQRSAQTQQGDWSEQATRWDKHKERKVVSPVELPDFGDRPALDEGAWEPEGTAYCGSTELPMDEVFSRLTRAGLTADDLVHLERLSDPRVRRRLGTNTTDFHHADRENVVRYLNAWASLLEEVTATDYADGPAEAYAAAAE